MQRKDSLLARLKSKKGAVLVNKAVESTASAIRKQVENLNLNYVNPKFSLVGHQKPVLCVALSPDSTYIASGSEDTTLRLWLLSNGAWFNTLEGHTKSVYSVAFSPNGKYIASGSHDCTARLWAASTGQPKRTFVFFSQVFTVAFSTNGEHLAVAGKSKEIQVWVVETGQRIFTLAGHTDHIPCIAYCPTGDFLASASTDTTIRLWKSDTGEPIGEPWPSHPNGAITLAFSPDGQLLASGGRDNKVFLWISSSGEWFSKPYVGHTSPLMHVEFSPDGHRMVTSQVSDLYHIGVHFWDISSGIQIGKIEGNKGDKATNAARYSPDGRYVVTWGWVENTKNNLRVWELAKPELPLKNPRSDEAGSSKTTEHAVGGGLTRSLTASSRRSAHVDCEKQMPPEPVESELPPVYECADG